MPLAAKDAVEPQAPRQPALLLDLAQLGPPLARIGAASAIKMGANGKREQIFWWGVWH